MQNPIRYFNNSPEIDYPEDIPVVEQALRVFKQTGRLPGEDEAGDSGPRFPV